MNYEIKLSISGLGIIFYSPFSVANLKLGENFLEKHFMEPEDIGKFVRDCKISAIGTGSSGDYVLKIYDGKYPEEDINKAWVAISLGIEVKQETLCFRDLYDLLNWNPICSDKQIIKIENGFYHITVFTNLPESQILGDNQIIYMYFKKVSVKPSLKWEGVPDISEPYK